MLLAYVNGIQLRKFLLYDFEITYDGTWDNFQSHCSSHAMEQTSWDSIMNLITMSIPIP